MADVLVPHVDNNHDAIVNALVDQFGIDRQDALHAVDATIDWGKQLTDADLWHWIEDTAYTIKSNQSATNQSDFLNPAPGAGASPSSKPGSDQAAQTVLRLAKGMGLYDGDPEHFQWTDTERAAVRAYQKKRGLAVTGEVDQATIDDAAKVGQFLGAPHRAAATATTNDHALAASSPAPAPSTAPVAPQTGPTAANAAAHLTAEDIAYYAKQAGFTGDGLVNIVAIALAESNGVVGAVGDSGQSHGLFQIYAPAHPQLDANRLMSDPAYAAKAAFDISGGGKNFTPWTTWTHSTPSGAAHPAQQFLTVAQQAAAKVDAGYTPTGATTTTAPPVGGAVGDRLPPNSTPEQIDAWIVTHYPSYASFLKNPEIRDILHWAAAEDASPDQLAAYIQNTDYWRSHGPSSRAFDQLLAQDPAEAGRAVDRAKATIADTFTRNGVTLDDKTLGDLAKNAIRDGSVNTDGQIVDQAAVNRKVAFGLNANRAGNLPAGDTAFNSSQLLAIARSEYLFPISQREADDWAVKILAGSETEQSFRSEMSNRAKNLYPWLTPQIEAGGTVQSATDGIRNAIANTLEIDPNTVNLLDPKWNAPLKMWDPASKTYRSMTEGEAAQWARDQTAFKDTQTYKHTDASFAHGVIDFAEGRTG